MLKFSRSKIIAIMFVVLAGLWFASPNVIPKAVLDDMPDWFPRDTIVLGLDLQGGSYMLLEVDVAAVIDERLIGLQDDVRRVLRQNNIRYTGLGTVKDSLQRTAFDGTVENITQNGTVYFSVSNEDERARALDLVEDLSQPITSNLLSVSARMLDVAQESDGRISLTFTEPGLTQIRTNAVDQSLEIVRRRIDELGTKEPTVQRQGDIRILVQVPGANIDAEIFKQAAKLTFYDVDTTASPEDIERGRVSSRSMILFEDPGTPDDPSDDTPIVLYKRPIVGGEHLTDAQPGRSQQSSLPVVNITFDLTGARLFGDHTKRNVGKRFAIVLDDKVISAPVIRDAILGGRAQISGSFTIESAAELSALLRAGALPAPLDVLEERSVGPDLGADSIAAGKIAAVIGFVAVMVYIVLSYGWFGVAANAALILNMIMIGGVLSLLQATLTLPGIAGIVLTIGMAVDANVLVFERIREEVRLGKPPLSAVGTGYSQAMSTILDANITTLIAAVIMFFYGTGPVRGFAVTLSIGIVTSVFAAVTLTRLMLSLWLRSRRPQSIRL